MKITGIVVLLMLSVLTYAQRQLFPFDDESRLVDNTTPYRELSDEGAMGVGVKYTFPGMWINQHLIDTSYFSALKIDNFSNLQLEGLPALPSHIDLIAIPEGAIPTLSIVNTQVDVYPNFKIIPATAPLKDIYASTYPATIPNSSFYSTSSVFPSNPVSIKGVIHIKGMDILMVEICPVQYNPVLRNLYVRRNLEYKISFGNSYSQFISKERYSTAYLSILHDLVINNSYLKQEIDHYISLNLNTENDNPSYIIFTNSQFKSAAEKLALWKSQLGFKTLVVVDNNWTSVSVKSKLSSIYSNCTRRPDFLLFLGDNSVIPPQIFTDSSGNTSATDLYYTCFNGSDDIYPDIALGRISVNSIAQANDAIRKIIEYECCPDTNNVNYYNSFCMVSNFQQSIPGYSKNMYSWTTEKNAKFLESLNKNVDRVYHAESSIFPMFWENKFFNSGENIPLSLKKPGFQWNGNYSAINGSINNGLNLLFYRGDGTSMGMVDPFYKASYFPDMYNVKNLPLFINLSSYGGKFTDAECFTEKIQRIPSGGMIGIFSHNSLSFSGYSDALGISLVDGMIGSPALLSNFTDHPYNSFPLESHKSISTTGFLHLYSLIKAVEFWGGTTLYQTKNNESFEFFGDPSLKIWQERPNKLKGNYSDTIYCYSDSLLAVTNLIPGSLVTLVNGNRLICNRIAQFDSVVLHIGKVNSETLILTISKENFVPIVDTIKILGGCSSASFICSSSYCMDDSVYFCNTSKGTIASYQWSFGVDASLSASSLAGPFYIKYSSPGNKTISLTTIGLNGEVNNYSETILIKDVCKFRMPVTASQSINKCNGTLTDDGGDLSNYSDNMESSTLIAPIGCSYISIQFSSFKTHSNADVISIYDGSSKNDVLIGEFSGNNLPFNGNVFYSTKSSILIVQKTDAANSDAGFELNWNCFTTTNQPICNFTSFDSLSCDGFVQFNNQSQNIVSALWDFGDGTFSTDINPVHYYPNNGLYNVKLKATNPYGSDSIVKQSFISINRPTCPVAVSNKKCKEGEIMLTAAHSISGKLYWYDAIQNGNLLFRGDTFYTPHLHESTTFYTELHSSSAPVYTGLVNNNGAGNFSNDNSINYLIFDSYKKFILKSIKVYSNISAYRTFFLLNSSDIVLESITVLIPPGEHRIDLNFEIPIGTNLKLAVNPNSNLYYSTGAIGYPFVINGILKIKSSGNHINPTGVYYFSYDWEVTFDDCVSDRIPVLAEIIDTLKPLVQIGILNSDPAIEFVNNTKYASSYYWDFGDGDFSFDASPVHTYQNNGLYAVSLIASNECGNAVYSTQIQINTSSIVEESSPILASVFPNPAHNSITISLKKEEKRLQSVEVFNALGEKILTINPLAFKGDNQVQIDTKDYASGIYFINFIGEKYQKTVRFSIY